jgi:hypothetical protein
MNEDKQTRLKLLDNKSIQLRHFNGKQFQYKQQAPDEPVIVVNKKKNSIPSPEFISRKPSIEKDFFAGFRSVPVKLPPLNNKKKSSKSENNLSERDDTHLENGKNSYL